jgi:hypothetical protein
MEDIQEGVVGRECGWASLCACWGGGRRARSGVAWARRFASLGQSKKLCGGGHHSTIAGTEQSACSAAQAEEEWRSGRGAQQGGESVKEAEQQCRYEVK